MSDSVIIPLPGLGTLDLPREVFERHLVRTAVPSTPEAQMAKLVDVNELARVLSVPTSTLYELRKAGRIPGEKIGKHVRFDVTAVRRALGT